MAGEGKALRETLSPGLPVVVTTGAACASNWRAWRSARRRAALFHALRSGSSARSRVWPTISAGLGGTTFGEALAGGAGAAARGGTGGLVIRSPSRLGGRGVGRRRGCIGRGRRRSRLGRSARRFGRGRQ